MITASYYRSLVTPKPLPERDLDLRISAEIEAGIATRQVEFTVRVQRIDVERATQKIRAYEYEVLAVNAAPEEDIAPALEAAARVGGYEALDFVEDVIVFQIPPLPKRAARLAPVRP